MLALHTYSGKKIELTGTTVKNGKTYITFKGAAKNTFVSCEQVTTLEGLPITLEMFAKPTKSALQQITDRILEINALSKYGKQSGEILAKEAIDLIAGIQMCAGGRGLTHLRDSESLKNDVKPNDFIASIADGVMKYGKCSDKQAYILAKYVNENRGSCFFKVI